LYRFRPSLSKSCLETQIGKLRRGMARLIDSYAEGLIDKQEFADSIGFSGKTTSH